MFAESIIFGLIFMGMAHYLNPAWLQEHTMIGYTLICGAMAFILIFYTMPSWLITFFEWLYPDVIFRVKTKEKIVALSIDDIIKGKSTEKILDVLKKHDVKCTFFLIGDYVKKYDPEHRVLERIKKEGHEIQNHTMRNYPSIFLNTDELMSQLRQTDEIIGNRHGLCLFRPGCGLANQRMFDATRDKYLTILGDNYPHDCQTRWPWLNKLHIMTKLHEGSIIILHDIDPTIETLDDLIPKIKNKGYQITTISDLLLRNGN